MKPMTLNTTRPDMREVLVLMAEMVSASLQHKNSYKHGSHRIMFFMMNGYLPLIEPQNLYLYGIMAMAYW